jgi:GTPase SAR1 family protein
MNHTHISVQRGSVAGNGPRLNLDHSLNNGKPMKLNIGMVGNSEVGKTSLIRKFVFNDNIEHRTY